MCKFLIILKCLLSSMNFKYSLESGFGKSSFEDKENNEDDLLNKGGLALMCNSESIASPSESDTIADSWCLENPVADESDMKRCVCVE